MDRLPIGVGHQCQEDDDQDRNRYEVTGRGCHATDADEDEHDLAGRVGGGRDRIGGEHREPMRLEIRWSSDSAEERGRPIRTRFTAPIIQAPESSFRPGTMS